MPNEACRSDANLIHRSCIALQPATIVGPPSSSYLPIPILKPPLTTNAPQKTVNPRLSTYSTAPTLAPSFAPSRLSTISKVSDAGCSLKSDGTLDTTATATATATVQTTNAKHIDIGVWHRSLEKMRDQRLEQQRFYISEIKKDEQGKLALGAKLERALSRRMTGQDAVRRDRKPAGVSLLKREY